MWLKAKPIPWDLQSSRAGLEAGSLSTLEAIGAGECGDLGMLLEGPGPLCTLP